jgi:hypothetical protein
MIVPTLFLTILVLLLVAAVYLLLRCWQIWRAAHQEPMSAVTRQHFEIFQSGEFNEAAVEMVKRRYRLLFERGGEVAVEATIHPGTHFIYQVRALAEIGTDAAGRILERQLQRRLSDDQLEQAWYWIDVAACLRFLNRQESLPNLLRCSETARESPLGHYFAAETMCILGFSGYLRQPDTPLGQSALRLLHRAVEGLRHGLQPNLIIEARLGDAIETIWDHRPDGPAPLHVRIFIEALRFLRRAPHWKTLLGDEMAEGEVFDWQFSRVASLEGAFREYLREAPAQLLAHVAAAQGAEQRDILLALAELRIDASAELLPMLKRTTGPTRAQIVEVLRWSRNPAVGLTLRDFVRSHVPIEKRARSKPAADFPRKPSVDPALAYAHILRCLRGHACVETEKLLLLACQDWDPTIRMAALGSLGWWEPLLREEVRACLSKCRRDPSPEVRQTARAALARLGERGSLHWFRHALFADDPGQVAQATYVIAEESLTMLWPDLDRLLDSDHPDIALHAREAVERMAEEMEQSRSWTS